MTQQELAEKLGVSRQAVSRWEQMISEPATENLIRIGKVFGVSVDSLIDDDWVVQEKNLIQGDVIRAGTSEKNSKGGVRMKQKLSAFNRYIYLAIALIIFIYERLLTKVYPRSTSILTGVYVIRSIGPLFSFFLMVYLVLAVVHYTSEMKKYRGIVRLSLIFGVAVTWIFLCNLMKTHTILMWGSYSVLPAIGFAIVLNILQKRNEEIT